MRFPLFLEQLSWSFTIALDSYEFNVLNWPFSILLSLLYVILGPFILTHSLLCSLVKSNVRRFQIDRYCTIVVAALYRWESYCSCLKAYVHVIRQVHYCVINYLRMLKGSESLISLCDWTCSTTHTASIFNGVTESTQQRRYFMVLRSLAVF